MKRFICTDRSLQLYSHYTPTVDEVLNRQPKPCKMYHEDHLLRWVLELEDEAKPVNMYASGIIWEPE